LEDLLQKYWPYQGRVIRTGNLFSADYADQSNYC
jgi:hypothetical protein